MVGVGKLLRTLEATRVKPRSARIYSGRVWTLRGAVRCVCVPWRSCRWIKSFPIPKRMVRRVVHVHVNANGRRALSPGEVGSGGD